jgi:O-antigen/teichoic acid export membrane protein
LNTPSALPPLALSRTLPPMYLAAAARLLFPLLVLPVMAGRLGADEFGRLGLLLVWSGLLGLLTEGGFLGAVTRHAVVADAARRLQLARQVFSARCVLCGGVLAAVVVAALAQGVPGPVPGEGSATAAALLAALACALGWPATWYLQATSQLHRFARVEVVVLALLLLATIAFAHSVEAYLLLQVVAAAALAGFGWRWVRRDLGKPMLWSPSEVRPGLHLGATMLPVSLAGAAYSLALPAIAASRMTRSELGVYFLADRLVRALLQAADPLVQVVYPRIVARFAAGQGVALRYAAGWAIGGLLAGAATYAALLFGWPLVERFLTGVEHARLAAVLTVAGLLLPLLTGWKFIGYWMLGSARYDHAYRACVVVGGVFGAAAAWWAGHDAVALAWVAFSAECVVIAMAVGGIVLTRRVRTA